MPDEARCSVRRNSRESHAFLIHTVSTGTSKRSFAMSQNLPTYERRGIVTCVRLGREFESLDETSLAEIREEMLENACKADPPRVLIDLSNVKFFGSSFIEVLFHIWNKVTKIDNGRFGICGLSAYCIEVLQITQLDKLWQLYPTLDEAVASMNS